MSPHSCFARDSSSIDCIMYCSERFDALINHMLDGIFVGDIGLNDTRLHAFVQLPKLFRDKLQTFEVQVTENQPPAAFSDEDESCGTRYPGCCSGNESYAVRKLLELVCPQKV